MVFILFRMPFELLLNSQENVQNKCCFWKKSIWGLNAANCTKTALRKNTTCSIWNPTCDYSLVITMVPIWFMCLFISIWNLIQNSYIEFYWFWELWVYNSWIIALITVLNIYINVQYIITYLYICIVVCIIHVRYH